MNKSTLEKATKIDSDIYYSQRDLDTVKAIKIEVNNGDIFLNYKSREKEISVSVPDKVTNRILDILLDYFKREKQDLEKKFEEM